MMGAVELRGLFEQVHLSRAVFESRAFTRVSQLEHLLREGRIDERLFWRNEIRGNGLRSGEESASA